MKKTNTTARFKKGDKVRVKAECKEQILSDFEADGLQDVQDGDITYKTLGRQLELIQKDSPWTVVELRPDPFDPKETEYTIKLNGTKLAYSCCSGEDFELI